MRWPFSRRTTAVWVSGGSEEPPERVAPPRPSDHARLLGEIEAGPPGWAADVLTTLLRDIGDGRTLELIAAVDAWIEDPSTFCLVYTAPFSNRDDALVGIRCRRGDLDPQLPIYRRRRVDIADFEMPDDPDDYAEATRGNIGEPLGNVALILRFDARGIGWWGTLDDTLPSRH